LIYKILFSLVLVISINLHSFSQENDVEGIFENENTEQTNNEENGSDLFNEETGFNIEDDTWMDKYFLIDRINLLLILKSHAKDLGITLEQMEQIKSFYDEYHPEMVKKAKLASKNEEELKTLILRGGNPKRIKELVVDIAKLKAELTIYNIKMVRVIQNTLTREQYERLLTYYEKSII
jgi:hypothetical protein